MHRRSRGVPRRDVGCPRGRASGGGSARVPGPPDARRRRPHPHHHVAAHTVVPPGEGRRTDPGVRVHAIGTDRIQTRVRHGGPGPDHGAVRRRRDDRPAGSASELGAGGRVLSRPRAAARASVPGERLHHSAGRPGTRVARRSARRLRAPGVRSQALGGPRGSGRTRARAARGGCGTGRLHLHAHGNAPRRDDRDGALRSPDGGRARDLVARRPHGGLAFVGGRPFVRRGAPGGLDGRSVAVRRPAARTPGDACARRSTTWMPTR